MGGVKASHFLLFSMITLLYLNDSDGRPNITTCPVDKLIRKEIGYGSHCGADWWAVDNIKNHKYFDLERQFATIDFDNIPVPVGHEVIELKFKPLEYNIIVDDE